MEKRITLNELIRKLQCISETYLRFWAGVLAYAYNDSSRMTRV